MSFELNVNGTRVRLVPEGFAVFMQGVCHLHAADHQTFGPQGAPVAVPEMRAGDVARAKVAEHFVLPDDGSGLAMAHQRYRITLDDGRVIEGTSSAHGETALARSDSTRVASVAHGVCISRHGIAIPTAGPPSALSRTNRSPPASPIASLAGRSRFGHVNLGRNVSVCEAIGSKPASITEISVS